MPPRVGFPLLEHLVAVTPEFRVDRENYELLPLPHLTGTADGKVMSQGWLGVTWMVGSGLRKSGPSAAARCAQQSRHNSRLKQPSSSPPTKRVRGSLPRSTFSPKRLPPPPLRGTSPARKCAGRKGMGETRLQLSFSSRFSFPPPRLRGEVPSAARRRGPTRAIYKRLNFSASAALILAPRGMRARPPWFACRPPRSCGRGRGSLRRGRHAALRRAGLEVR